MNSKTNASAYEIRSSAGRHGVVLASIRCNTKTVNKTIGTVHRRLLLKGLDVTKLLIIHDQRCRPRSCVTTYLLALCGLPKSDGQFPYSASVRSQPITLVRSSGSEACT